MPPATTPTASVPPAAHPPHPSQVSAARRWAGPGGGAGVLLVTMGVLGTIGLGSPGQAGAGLASVVMMVALAGGIALAYVVGAIGWGRLVTGLLAKDSPSRVWIQLPAGLGLALLASHALGVLGLLSGPSGVVAAWGFVGIGIALTAHQVFAGELRPERWPVASVWLWLGAPGLGVMLVAACSPPGWLWSSEGGGYDVLSYHLQLVKEWLSGDAGLLGAGRLWPIEHNVYSFLPSHMEAAFLHVAAMAGAGSHPGALVDADGLGVIAPQMLHALVGLVGAITAARTTWVVLNRASVPGWCARFGACCCAAMILSTPWSVVVGSMAYNELAVVALGCGALLVSIDGGSKPLRRAILVGALVGVATSAKPTAILLIGPVCGLAMLAMAPKRSWVPMVLVGSVAGVGVMLAWLVRNYLACANPVFPFATGLFGSAHWSAEQVARYAAAHRFDGNVLDRLMLAFSSQRGMMHHQWAFVFPVGLLCLIVTVAWGQTRRIGVVLALGVLAGLGAWLMLTHVQARFLVPLLGPIAIGFGLACAWLARAGADSGSRVGVRTVVGVGLASLTSLALAGASVWIFVLEPGGHGIPNAMLIGGVAGRTGWYAMEDSPEERASYLSEPFVPPDQFINLAPFIGPDDRILLVGDAQALYFLGDPVRIVSHTTYDASPLGDAIRAHPDDPDAWSDALHAQGIRYAVIDFGQLDRLWSSVPVRDDDGFGPPNGWYDPSVTPEALLRWLSRFRPIATFHKQGQNGEPVVSAQLVAIPAHSSGARSAPGAEGGAPSVPDTTDDLPPDVLRAPGDAL